MRVVLKPWSALAVRCAELRIGFFCARPLRVARCAVLRDLSRCVAAPLGICVISMACYFVSSRVSLHQAATYGRRAEKINISGAEGAAPENREKCTDCFTFGEDPIIELKQIIKLFHLSGCFTFQILAIIIELK